MREPMKDPDSGAQLHEAITWNPYNKVVQDHRDGTIYYALTDRERAARGLPVPWTPELAAREQYEAPVE